MKAKTIKAVLAKKFNEFLGSIEDESLRKRVKEGTIITGGCITSMLLKEAVNDFDMYFLNQQLAYDVAKYYVDKFKADPPFKFKEGSNLEMWVESLPERIKIVIKSAGLVSDLEGSRNTEYQYFEGSPDEQGEQFVEANVPDRDGGVTEGLDSVGLEAAEKNKPPYRPVFLSANAISLSGKVQLIVRFFGNPEEIHANYDFVHCTCYWKSWDNELVLPAAALEAMLARELIYVGSKYPLCSIIRTRKFIQRGWSINAGQYLKMFFQLNTLNLTDLKVLEDQLIGVDSAYFLQLIDRLKAADEKEPGKVDSTYIVSIIDRIF